MESRSTSSIAQDNEVGVVAKVLFGLTCFISFVCIIFLSSLKESANKAMQGELITTSADTLVNSNNQTFIAKLFEYFGNVTYLFPLVLIFIGYKLFIKKVKISQIDFFLVGLFILGFNLFSLGMCSVFSAISSLGQTGAGGILGDFFNICFVKISPSFLAPIFPIILTAIGLFLMSAHGPLWYCDFIGAKVNFLISLLNGTYKKQAKNSQGKANKKSNLKADLKEDLNEDLNDPKAELKDDSLAVNMPYQKRQAGEEFENFNRKTRPQVQANLPPSTPTRDNPLKTDADILNENMPSFGGAYRSSFLPDIEPKDLKKDEKSKNKPGFNLNNRIEPNFGPTNLKNEKPEPKKSGATIYPGVGNPLVRMKEDDYPNLQDSSSNNRVEPNDDNGPKTYITGLSYPSNQDRAAFAKREDQNYQNQNSDDPNVKKTIITRIEFTNSKNQTSSNYQEPIKEKEPSIIYKAGADHLPPIEKVGSPMRQSDVSTVITRTTEIPVNNNVKVKQVDNGIQGQIANEQSSTIITTTPKVNSLAATYNNSNPKAMQASSEYKEENVLNFSDLLQDEPKAEIKVDNLSSAFIPSEHDNKLQTSTSELLKESELSKDRYSRGINPSGQNSNSQTNAYQNSYQTSNTNQDSATNPSYQGTNSQNQSASSATYQDKSNSANYNQESSSNYNYQAATPSYQDTNAQGSTLNNSNSSAFNSNASPSNMNLSDSTALGSNGASQDYDGEEYSEYKDKVPFDDMSSLSGAVPRGDNRIVMRTPNGGTVKVAYARATETSPSVVYDDWRPSFDLLTHSQNTNFTNDDEVIGKTQKINDFMRDFGVKAHVARDVRGPVISRYDMALEPGIKSGTIVNLTNDLQRYLMTDKINIIQAVPGTPYMGIEVPNMNRQLITLADVVESAEFTQTKAILPICLGVDTVGNPVVVDLAVAPHLLIAGTTGSGKSAGVNSMLVSLLLSRSPAELRLIMVDPKTVEFSQYQGLPHLLTPIITDPEAAVASLNWLIKEQERRYKLLSKLGTQNIAQCNNLIRSQNAQGIKVVDPTWTPDMGGMPSELKPLPYIVIVVDEFADLMAVASENKKGSNSGPDFAIGRLAQKARAAGIHLIIATQTPRADIVTGNIKANLASRIAFTVQNQTESRIILDDGGAENLLGNGDMMVKFQQVNRNNVFRAHGPYTSGADVHSVVNAWIERYGEPEYVEDVTAIEDDSEDQGVGGAGLPLDKLFDEVVAYARQLTDSKGQPKPLSKSEIQTAFGIGFNRANKIHRQLQQEGIIDSKGRSIY